MNTKGIINWLATYVNQRAHILEKSAHKVLDFVLSRYALCCISGTGFLLSVWIAGCLFDGGSSMLIVAGALGFAIAFICLTKYFYDEDSFDPKK